MARRVVPAHYRHRQRDDVGRLQQHEWDAQQWRRDARQSRRLGGEFSHERADAQPDDGCSWKSHAWKCLWDDHAWARRISNQDRTNAIAQYGRAEQLGWSLRIQVYVCRVKHGFVVPVIESAALYGKTGIIIRS
jgi:hypothetical protein